MDQRALGGYIVSYGDRVQPYRDCVKEAKPVPTRPCDRILSSICRNSTLVAAKTIRTPLYMVNQLLQSLPGLKVIYYTRDPRGMIRSRITSFVRNNSKAHDVKREIGELCNVTSADFSYSRSLASKYPNRFKLLKYEQLAMEPKETAEDVYRFLGQSVPNSVVSWMEKNTVTYKKGSLSTTKISRETAYGWRKEFDPELQEELTKICRGTLEVLGYPE